MHLTREDALDLGQFNLGQFDLRPIRLRPVPCVHILFGRLGPIRLKPIGPNCRLSCVVLCCGGWWGGGVGWWGGVVWCGVVVVWCGGVVGVVWVCVFKIFVGAPPDPSGRQGFTRQPGELQTCTFQGPGASHTTKIPRKDPQERKKERKMWREREKSWKFWAPPPPTLRGPTLRGPTIRGPHAADTLA